MSDRDVLLEIHLMEQSPSNSSVSGVVQQHAFLPADGPMAGGHVVLTTDASPVLQELCTSEIQVLSNSLSHSGSPKIEGRVLGENSALRASASPSRDIHRSGLISSLSKRSFRKVFRVWVR